MKQHKNTEDQDIEMTEGFETGDLAAETEGDTTDNLADECANLSDDNGQSDTPDKPAPPTPEEEAAMWKDKFVRLSAEFENYRKRTFKEKLDLIAAGGEDVVRGLLDSLDDIDRAMDAMAKTDDLESIRQGIALIDTKLRGALGKQGLAEIEAVGLPLDTDLHEAVARIPVDDEAQKGLIIDVAQKGYKLKDKVIRYAKVVVGQ